MRWLFFFFLFSLFPAFVFAQEILLDPVDVDTVTLDDAPPEFIFEVPVELDPFFNPQPTEDTDVFTGGSTQSGDDDTPVTSDGDEEDTGTDVLEEGVGSVESETQNSADDSTDESAQSSGSSNAGSAGGSAGSGASGSQASNGSGATADTSSGGGSSDSPFLGVDIPSFDEPANATQPVEEVTSDSIADLPKARDVAGVSLTGIGTFAFRASTFRKAPDAERSFSITEASNVVNTDAFVQFATYLSTQDEAITHIVVEKTEISFRYKQPGRLLWLIPIRYTQRVTATIEDDVRVTDVEIKDPWWSFLMKRLVDKQAVKQEIEERLRSTKSADLVEAGLEALFQERANILHVIATALGRSRETAT